MTSQNSISNLVIGQCWTSEGEPELGIGFVRALDSTSVAIEYPASSQARLYRRKNAPLRRLEFRVGEKIKSVRGESLLIEGIESRDGLFYYSGINGGGILENELSPELTLQRPVERFLSGKWDTLKAFQLRRRALDEWNHQLQSPARGLLGARAELLPHQLYVTDQITNRGFPRALLSDEVGLGKTIEAAWILHRLSLTGRLRRVLIIVPEALVNQWFVELIRRFNLSFWVPPSQTEEDLVEGDFDDHERVIISTESFARLYEEKILSAESWDLVIVDEAHRIVWSEGNPSAEYSALEKIAEHSPGLLLLTATPEQLGIEGHFSRLRLIDPERFSSLSSYVKEQTKYTEVVKLTECLMSEKTPTTAEKTKLTKLLEGKVSEALCIGVAEWKLDPEERRSISLALVDHYGTGRITFRNSRRVVELDGHAFPKRRLNPVPLTDTLSESLSGKESAARILTRWIGEFATEHRSEKTLLICNSARKAAEWEKFLKEELNLKAVSFHENLSLLARDRSAAYFEDPKGASILLCSEIGGEGRNFQNASNLILPDLPWDPDVLEQRIGRLDRIGQRSDIDIYVPYVKGTEDERRLQWHDEVFDAFRAPPKGAGKIYQAYHEQLQLNDKKSFPKLLKAASAAYAELVKEIEAGRDRLIELNSFDPTRAKTLVETMNRAERKDELRAMVDDLMDSFGMTSDDLDAETVFIEPGQSQYAAYVPGLPSEGMSFTYSRSKALARTDLSLLTWDHPIVRGTLEALALQEYGNVAVGSWSESLLAVECSFVIEPGATDPKWFPEEYFPSASVRVLLDAGGKDLSKVWPVEVLNGMLKPLPPAMESLVKTIPGEKMREVLRKAHVRADAETQSVRKAAEAKMHMTIDAELLRLAALQKKNRLVREGELEWWKERKTQLSAAFSGAQVRLDSFLLIIPSK